MSYTVRVDRYEPSQLLKLFELFRTYFPEGNRLLSPVYSDWLYGQNPFGRASMVSVSHGERWAAFMALVPVTFERAGEELPVHYVVNVLVDPQHQGRYLFARMIASAREHIGSDGCLMGHPNVQAMKTWQRARMHFQQELRPTLALPWIRSRGWTARRARDVGDVGGLCVTLRQDPAAHASWKVALSTEYLQWRYFAHPTSKYKLQILGRADEPAGLQISRQMRPGVHLLMDQFVADEHIPAASSLLPPATVCFIPESALGRMGGALVRLPIRKRIPYFFTRQPSVAAEELIHLNLSASDF